MSAAPALATLHLVPSTPADDLTLADAIARGRAERAGSGPYVQGALAVDFDPDPEPAPEPTLDPRAVAATLAQALLEVMAGTRAASQLIAWTTPAVHAVVARHGALAHQRAARSTSLARPRQRLRVLRVLVGRPGPQVAEVSVVLADGPRVRAMALRMVCPDGRWRIDALQLG